MTPTNGAGDPPPIQIEWTARQGDARRATLSSLAAPRLWSRTVGVAAVFATIFAAVCIATGSGWTLGLLIGVGVFLFCSVAWIGAALIAAYFQNRRMLAPGATWGAGADDEFLRVDTPASTVLLRRDSIRSVTPVGGQLVMLKASPKTVRLLPAALFAEPVWTLKSR